MEAEDPIPGYIREGNLVKLNQVLSRDPQRANGKTEQGISYLTYAAYCNKSDALELMKRYKSGFDVYERILLGNLEAVRDCLEKDRTGLIDMLQMDSPLLVWLAFLVGMKS